MIQVNVSYVRTFCEVLLGLEALAAGAAGEDGLPLTGHAVQLLPALLPGRHRRQEHEAYEDGCAYLAAVQRLGKMLLQLETVCLLVTWNSGAILL